jgi:hypothetical protein
MDGKHTGNIAQKTGTCGKAAQISRAILAALRHEYYDLQFS